MQRISTTMAQNDTNDEESLVSAIELDSHADSPVAGKVARVINRTGKTVTVSGFTDKLGKPIRVPVVDAAVLYVCDRTGKEYIMILRNALYVPEMDACLIHPIMMRLIGIQVDECPKFLSPNPTEINHSIYFEKQNLRIPLLLSGVISFMPCKYPEMKDMEENDGILELTPNVDNWNPHDHVFQDQEEAMVDFGGKIKVSQPRNFIVSAVSSRSMDSDLVLDDINDGCAIGSVRFMTG